LPSGTGLDVCEAIHAEQNALLQCKDVEQIDTAYVTAMPCMTLSGVNKFMRPAWSSGPKSPQVEPSGLCFQRVEWLMVCVALK
jgi:hypothetical protein